MYAYSNNGLNVRAISPGMETADEVVFDHVLSEVELAASFPAYVPFAVRQAKVEAHGKVQALELAQARAIREALLTGDTTRLKNIEQQIAQLMGRTPVGM